MTDHLNSYLTAMTEIARKAGEIQLGYFRHAGLHVDTKLNEADIVTAADGASDRYIIGELQRRFPTHSILSEEAGMIEGSDKFLWVVDPLDGTTNFTEGLPNFSISIALKIDGVTSVGVVYAPYLREIFTAIRGEGARLNGHPAKVRPNRLIERAVVATGFPVDKNVDPDNNLDNVARVLPLIRGLRRLGSAAIDLCYVAAGFLDGYWECNLHEWDVAAGRLIAEEAGAKVERYRPDRNISLLAATPAIFDSLRPLLK